MIRIVGGRKIEGRVDGGRQVGKSKAQNIAESGGVEVK